MKFLFYYLVPTRREAVEIETNVGNPADAPHQVILRPTHSTTAIVSPKPISTIRPNNQTGDEQST